MPDNKGWVCDGDDEAIGLFFESIEERVIEHMKVRVIEEFGLQGVSAGPEIVDELTDYRE